MVTVEDRVDRLEEALQNFVSLVGAEFNKLYKSQMRTEAELRAFKDDTQVFKDEMKVFKDEMKVFKDEMLVFKDEMKDFKNEMRAFKDEMSDFKEESRRQTREMNRQWGELSNKLGTMVEDLVAPSLSRIIKGMLNREVSDLSVRRKKRLPDGRGREYDAVAVTDDLICLNSTKSTLRSADVDRFVEEIASFREFFPEYRKYPIVGILASLWVEESVLNYAEKIGFMVLATGDQVMEVKNHPGFEPKHW